MAELLIPVAASASNRASHAAPDMAPSSSAASGAQDAGPSDSIPWNRKHETFLACADELKLSKELFELMNKAAWVNLMFLHKHIVRYAITGDTFGHWAIFALTDEGVVIQTELIWDFGKDVDYEERGIIRSVNEGDFKEDGMYIMPRTIVNCVSKASSSSSSSSSSKNPILAAKQGTGTSAQASSSTGGPKDIPPIKDMTLINPPCDWNKFIVAIALDPQVYRPYHQYKNNCQHWCNRVCTRLGLPPRKVWVGGEKNSICGSSSKGRSGPSQNDENAGANTATPAPANGATPAPAAPNNGATPLPRPPPAADANSQKKKDGCLIL